MTGSTYSVLNSFHVHSQSFMALQQANEGGAPSMAGRWREFFASESYAIFVVAYAMFTVAFALIVYRVKSY